MRSMTILAWGACIALIAAAALPWGRAAAQQDTIYVPVTFYDFRSDRSNPEFEQPHQGGLRTGMVAATLDADNKPQSSSVGASHRSLGIAHWFRDWHTYMDGPYSRGTNRAPVYSPTPAIRQRCGGGTGEMNCNEWGANVTIVSQSADVGHDTSFKNIVIRDQLPFTLVRSGSNAGMYQYDRRGSNQFFPLDGRGFGNEWPAGTNDVPNHNFAFTMEMVYPFEARADMSFSFSGDDDVWVFINNRLALDIGGIHSEEHGSFRLGDVPGVEMGKQNILRVFYAERHTTASNIRIQTNIISAPGSLQILEVTGANQTRPIPGTFSKDADDTVTVTVEIRNKDGIKMEIGPGEGQYQCEHVKWTISDDKGYKREGTGCEIAIGDPIAGNIIINAVYHKPGSEAPPVEGQEQIRIWPLEPACIFIQSTPAPKDRPQDYKGCADGRLSDDIFFNPNDQTVPVYAILRDKYGNAVNWLEGSGNDRNKPAAWGTDGSYAGRKAEWQSDNPDVAMFVASPTSGSPYQTGSGAVMTVRKMEVGEGSQGSLIVSFVYVDEAGRPQPPISDTVFVGSKREPGIAIGPNPFRPGVDNIYTSYPSTVASFYDNPIKNSGAGKGGGILIAVTAPKPLTPQPGGRPGTGGGNNPTPYGKVMIYDAVGNVVHIDYLYKAQYATSYGYVWDGKNTKGRNVGPGTYLVRVTGRDEDGEPFNVQRKVGVTKR